MYSFKELMITPVESGEDEYLKYRAMKRRKHMYEDMNPYLKHSTDKLKNKHASFSRQIGDLQTKKLKGAKNPSIDQEIAKYQQKLRHVKNAMKSEATIEDNDESTDEALSMQSRMKRSRDMRKNKNKLAIARKRMSKRVANPERIKKRARKQARDMIYKKLTKGIPRSDLTPAKKRELEKRIDKMKPRVNRLTRKIMPKVRQRAHGK